MKLWKFLFLFFCFTNIIIFVYSQDITPKEIYVIDIKNEDFKTKVLATTFQGVVNKLNKNLKLYLVSGKEDPLNFWVMTYKKNYKIKTHYLNLIQILENFNSYLENYVVYTEAQPFTINIATTIAGLNNAVVVEENLIPLINKFNNKAKLVFNCVGKFKNEKEGYLWAFKKYYPKCNKKYLGITNAYKIRDFLIANNIFTFFANPKTKGRSTLLEILKNTPENIFVIGYLSRTGEEEYFAVTALSHYGKTLIPGTTANLSVHSTFPSIKKNELPLIKPVKKSSKKINAKGKVVVVLAISDGDNLILGNEIYPKADYWLSKNRGKLNIGWSLSPQFINLAPELARYYAKTVENDELVEAIGMGYTHPSYYKDLNYFFSETKKITQKFGFTTLWTIDPALSGTKFSPKAREILLKISEVPFTVLLSGYDPYNAIKEYLNLKLNEISSKIPADKKLAILYCELSYFEDIEKLKARIEKLIASLKPDETKVIFYGLSVWQFSYETLYNGLKEFLNNDKVIFITPREVVNYLN